MKLSRVDFAAMGFETIMEEIASLDNEGSMELELALCHLVANTFVWVYIIISVHLTHIARSTK